IAYKGGAPVRLDEVGDVIDGVENAQLAGWANRDRAIILNVQRQPGANVIQTADRVKGLLPQLKATLSQGIDVNIVADRTETVRASVDDVQFTLVLTIVLVVAVIYVFLRSLRATMIPGVAVPLSLIGTFGVMYLCGYSLNNLSLMALTISTGFVVDDAVVMIENISRYIEEGEQPLRAAFVGSAQIGFTILSLTVSLIAVLIPLLFMGDIVGRLFRELALALTFVLYTVVPKGLFPVQDTGVILGISEAPQNVSFDAMAQRQRALGRMILQDPAVANISSFIGIDGTNTTLNSGRIQITLKPLAERGESVGAVIDRLRPALAQVNGITLYLQPVQDLTVENRVSRTQFQYSLEDPDEAELRAWAPKFLARLRALPELRDVATDQLDQGLQATVQI